MKEKKVVLKAATNSAKTKVPPLHHIWPRRNCQEKAMVPRLNNDNGHSSTPNEIDINAWNFTSTSSIDIGDTAGFASV